MKVLDRNGNKEEVSKSLLLLHSLLQSVSKHHTPDSDDQLTPQVLISAGIFRKQFSCLCCAPSIYPSKYAQLKATSISETTCCLHSKEKRKRRHVPECWYW